MIAPKQGCNLTQAGLPKKDIEQRRAYQNSAMIIRCIVAAAEVCAISAFRATHNPQISRGVTPSEFSPSLSSASHQ
jgi:hypothetical protein